MDYPRVRYNPFCNLRICRWYRVDALPTIIHFFYDFITFKYRKSYIWINNVCISSCLTSLNSWTTIHFLRSYYLILSSIPLFPWAFLITAFMLLLTLPILSGTLLSILGDLHSNILFFDPIFGGDPIFYQLFFWHPEVYILIFPAFGVISIIISGILQLPKSLLTNQWSLPCHLFLLQRWKVVWVEHGLVLWHLSTEEDIWHPML